MSAVLAEDLQAIERLQQLAWQTSESKGWHEPREIEGVVRDASTGERLALVHSEISEAMEEVRNGNYTIRWEDGKPEGIGIELADAFIRILDLAQSLEVMGLKVDFPEALGIKMNFNLDRTFRHGGKLL